MMNASLLPYREKATKIFKQFRTRLVQVEKAHFFAFAVLRCCKSRKKPLLQVIEH